MAATGEMRLNVYRSITASIVTAIEAGAGTFELPWHRHLLVPVNAFTGKRYRGVNVVALWSAQMARSFGFHQWATYRQWSRLGAQVRRGEKSSLIVFYKRTDPDDDEEASETEDRKGRSRLIARASWVFNADQVDGYERPTLLPANPVKVLALAEDFVKRTGAVIRHGGDAAFYSLSGDYIQIPERAAFAGTATSSPTEGFYATLCHELVHWSGAGRRLARDLSGRFGSNSYAMEELVGELDAAFLCAELGVTSTPRPDHAAYLSTWLKVLKADSRAIFTAASKATEAAEYLLGLNEKTRAAKEQAAGLVCQ